MVVVSSDQQFNRRSHLFIVTAFTVAVAISMWLAAANQHESAISPSVDRNSIAGRIAYSENDHGTLILKLVQGTSYRFLPIVKGSGYAEDMIEFLRNGDSVLKKSYSDSILIIRNDSTFSWRIVR